MIVLVIERMNLSKSRSREPRLLRCEEPRYNAHDRDGAKDDWGVCEVLSVPRHRSR